MEPTRPNPTQTPYNANLNPTPPRPASSGGALFGILAAIVLGLAILIYFATRESNQSDVVVPPPETAAPEAVTPEPVTPAPDATTPAPDVTPAPDATTPAPDATTPPATETPAVPDATEEVPAPAPAE